MIEHDGIHWLRIMRRGLPVVDVILCAAAIMGSVYIMTRAPGETWMLHISALRLYLLSALAVLTPLRVMILAATMRDEADLRRDLAATPASGSMYLRRRLGAHMALSVAPFLVLIPFDAFAAIVRSVLATREESFQAIRVISALWMIEGLCTLLIATLSLLVLRQVLPSAVRWIGLVASIILWGFVILLAWKLTLLFGGAALDLNSLGTKPFWIILVSTLVFILLGTAVCRLTWKSCERATLVAE